MSTGVCATHSFDTIGLTQLCLKMSKRVCCLSVSAGPNELVRVFLVHLEPALSHDANAISPTPPFVATLLSSRQLRQLLTAAHHCSRFQRSILSRIPSPAKSQRHCSVQSPKRSATGNKYQPQRHQFPFCRSNLNCYNHAVSP